MSTVISSPKVGTAKARAGVKPRNLNESIKNAAVLFCQRYLAHAFKSNSFYGCGAVTADAQSIIGDIAVHLSKAIVIKAVKLVTESTNRKSITKEAIVVATRSLAPTTLSQDSSDVWYDIVSKIPTLVDSWRTEYKKETHDKAADEEIRVRINDVGVTKDEIMPIVSIKPSLMRNVLKRHLPCHMRKRGDEVAVALGAAVQLILELLIHNVKPDTDKRYQLAPKHISCAIDRSEVLKQIIGKYIMIGAPVGLTTAVKQTKRRHRSSGARAAKHSAYAGYSSDPSEDEAEEEEEEGYSSASDY